jgi:ribose-phosphate pyrophosphokinase
LCLERGATCVHAAATHGVFSEHAAERLADPMLASIVVTDSVSDAAERGRSLADKLVVLESAALVADALR